MNYELSDYICSSNWDVTLVNNINSEYTDNHAFYKYISQQS